jgi:polyhydroxybutyrate depolymerase
MKQRDRGGFRGDVVALVRAGQLLVACAVGLSACASDRKPGASEVVRLEPGAVAASSGTAAACGAPALPSGVSEQHLTSGGVERRFLVYLPSGAGPSAGWPVVFNLHGSGGTPEGQLQTSQLAVLADTERFAIVAPAAIDNRWNVPPEPQKPDDVRFVSDILDALRPQLCFDSRHVYSTGFSGGARMSSQLACDLSERIAAIAAIGGIRFPGPCSTARAIPILAFHGTGDETNPFAGGGAPYWGTGVEDAISGWARHNGCPGPAETRLAPLVTQEAYAGSACGEVILYRIEGFGHAWPGVIDGDPEHGTANDILWRFFESHPLPG